MDSKMMVIALVAFLTAGAISFGATPLVKKFASRVGAIDVPKDARRMHKVPIPRLGGLAIFFGFLASILLFGELSYQMRGILLGALVIVALGVIDDIIPLNPFLKFAVQIGAALIPVAHGIIIQRITNPNIFSGDPYLDLSVWAIPLTVVWIVGITNAVNLIDGLDGLAVGVSTIAAISLFAVAVLVADPAVAVVMAALAGACAGFMPYNVNPAKIFMGDTGATFLGFILATVSIQGLFKLYAVISFAVPFLILGLPIFDTVIAIFRRLMKGKNPMRADRGHVHHRLMDMGLSQKQSVAILYTMSGILGLIAVVLTSSGELKAMILILAVVAALAIGMKVFSHFSRPGEDREKDNARPEGKPDPESPEAGQAETKKENKGDSD